MSKRMPLYIGGAVSLVLLLGAGGLLFMQQGAFSGKTETMEEAGLKLKKLTDRKPFPSAANVNRLDSQLEVYTVYQDELFSSMSKGQEAVGTVDQDRFRRLLAENLTQLVREARAKSVAIPVQFPFGFHRYVAGSLPDPGEMPRLMSQMQGVTQICHILYESGISELLGVERTEFEKAAAGAAEAAAEDASSRRGRRNRGGDEEVADTTDSKALYTDPDGLFTREHYVVRFRARDAAIQKCLDRFAKGAPFTVVTRMDLVNPNRPVVAVQPDAVQGIGEEDPFGAPPPPAWGAPPPPPGPAAKENEPLPRDLRVIAGRELPEVRFEIDVYRFIEPARGDDAADGQEEPK
jgi:hypothetical protein